MNAPTKYSNLDDDDDDGDELYSLDPSIQEILVV